MKTIIYDGNCKFCRRFAQWCVLKNSDFIIYPVRDKIAKKTLHTIGLKFINLQTIYLIEDTNISTKSDAVFKILKNIGFPWSLISLFSIFPVKTTDYFYNLFAKYRYYF